MTRANRLALAGAALAASVTLAVAQTPQDHDAHHPGPGSPPPMQQRPAMRGPMQPGANGMMGGDMAQMMTMMTMMRDGMMPMGMGPAGMRPLQHIEGQIAFYKAELRITDAQLPQWNTFADALRASATRMQQAVTPALAAGVSPALEQIERRIALLSAQLDAMQAVLAAAKPLYGVLTDEQKRSADQLTAEHMMVMQGRRM